MMSNFLKILLKMFIVHICIWCHASGEQAKYDPCCSLPCQNNGICYSKGSDHHVCDCTGTGFYGNDCETILLSTWVRNIFKPSVEILYYFLQNFEFIWRIINNTPVIRKYIMGKLLEVRVNLIDEPASYVGMDEFSSWQTYTNKTVYARTLPPIPENCPTPMGSKGKKILPDPWLLASRFLLREKDRPCPERTNLIFPMFAQHFSHQFFKTDLLKGMPFQWGGHGVDLSHVYGDTVERQHALRSHIGGKMKISRINGEDFPPLAKDVPEINDSASHIIEPEYSFVQGHVGFHSHSTFLLISTIWLREHNRVCDVLKEEHPEWDGERLFQTARLILIGETIKIIIEDYEQHLSGFHYKLIYDPEIMYGSSISYHNQIHQEFQFLYHWHALVPDLIRIDKNVHKIKDLMFNSKPIVERGLSGALQDFNKQFANRMAGRGNQGSSTIAVAAQVIKDARKLRLYPMNKYRTRFGLKPYGSFEELTGETVMASELEELYGDIDAMELFIGMMIEKRRNKQLFGKMITDIGAPFSLKGLYGNPLSSPVWWKPVTFGGQRGFDIIKTTNLQKLICRNVKDCPQISFKVPKEIVYIPLTKEKKTEVDDSASVLMTLGRQPTYAESYTSSRTSWKIHPLYNILLNLPSKAEAMKVNANKATTKNQKSDDEL